MAHGFFRVAAATPTVRIADPPRNAEAILKEIEAADKLDVQFLLFPEAVLTGATCGDLFFQQPLLNAAEEALCKLIKATERVRTLICAGFPLPLGGRLYNAAAVFGNGRLYGICGEREPRSSEGIDRSRYFSSAPEEPQTVSVAGFSVPFGSRLIFDLKVDDETFPMTIVFGDDPQPTAGALLLARPFAAAEIAGAAEFRRSVAVAESGLTHSVCVYAGSGRGESTGDAVFGGGCLIAENGSILRERSLFDDEVQVSVDVDFQRLTADRQKNRPRSAEAASFCIPVECPPRRAGTLMRRVSPYPFVPADKDERARRCRLILRLQTEGLAQRLRQTRIGSVVLGLSGGLDSTLALLAAVSAFDLLRLPKTNIVCLTMPGFGTTDRTKNNAFALAQAAGVSLKEIPIKEATALHFKDIGHDPSVTDAVYENAQARERTQVLMDTANGLNALVLGTGDLSEAALGWATFNGDHMAMYGVNASIPKTLMRELVRFSAESLQTENPQLAQLLTDVLNTPVSPELLPPKDGKIVQETEALVGPYELHDFFLYYTVRFGFSPEKIFTLAQTAFTEENGCPRNPVEIRRWLEIFFRRFFSQQFKRNCSPEAPRVGSVSLSPRGGWLMPSDAEAAVWLDGIGKIDANA